jgi:hypothetical protein
MEITQSARKHGRTDEEILHAWRNMIRYHVYEYAGEERVLVIGPDLAGELLELVAVPSHGPARIVHADELQPSRHKYL